MCGLVYIRRKDGKPANRSVRKRYYKQRHRGSSGFGYVAIRDNKVVSYKRAPTEHEIMNLLQKETAPEILFHHRFPTSTPNMEEQSHPLLVQGGGLARAYYIAHNGVIRNPNSRKLEHERLGFSYLTELKPYLQTFSKKFYSYGDARFNDSEALAVDTALALESRLRTIDSEGAAAVIGIAVEGDQVVDRFFYRNRGNPLLYHDDKVMTTLTSSGSGREVEPVYIMQLNENGTFTEHPAKIWTPWQNKTGTYGTSSLPLTLAENTVAFKTDPSDIEFDYGISDPEFTEAEIAGADKQDLLLASLPKDTLMLELAKVEQAEKSMEEALASFDKRFSKMGTADAKVIGTYNGLLNRLDRIKAYGLRVCIELEARESILQSKLD